MNQLSILNLSPMRSKNIFFLLLVCTFYYLLYKYRFVDEESKNEDTENIANEGFNTNFEDSINEK